MNNTASQPLAHIGLECCEDDGATFVALPNRRAARWVVPVEGRLRRAGMQLYSPASVAGSVLKALISAGVLRGERVMLPAESIAELESKLAAAVGVDRVRLAFSTGTAGAYRKATVQIMDANASIIAYAKIGADRAKPALETEYANLQKLATLPLLSQRVPSPIAKFDWESNVVVVFSSGPAQLGPRKLADAHLTFLEKLHRSTSANVRFRGSDFWRRVSEQFHSLGAQLSEEWRTRFRRAIESLGSRFGDVTVPMSMAHRDFAPWNTRMRGAELFVFDWESAGQQYTPGYDAFHFEFMLEASDRKSQADERSIRKLIEMTWPEGVARQQDLELAYLLDMALWYAEARVRAPEQGDSRVLDFLGRKLDAHLR